MLKISGLRAAALGQDLVQGVGVHPCFTSYLLAGCERRLGHSTRSRSPGRRSEAGALPAPAARSLSLCGTPRAGERRFSNPLRSAFSLDSANPGKGCAGLGPPRPAPASSRTTLYQPPGKGWSFSWQVSTPSTRVSLSSGHSGVGSTEPWALPWPCL